jgi:splicing factor 3B subunit 3
VQFHVGDVVTCLQKASLFLHLEMHLCQEHPPLCGRDHMAYRSSYFPVKVEKNSDMVWYEIVIAYVHNSPHN